MLNQNQNATKLTLLQDEVKIMETLALKGKSTLNQNFHCAVLMILINPIYKQR